MPFLRVSRQILFGISIALFGNLTSPLEAKEPSSLSILTRGSGNSLLVDSWSENGQIYFLTETSKGYKGDKNGFQPFKLSRPKIVEDSSNIFKFRRGEWYSFTPETAPSRGDLNSYICKYEAAQKKWIVIHELAVRASNFEPLEDGSIALFGVYDPEENKYYVGATLSPKGSLSYWDEVPFAGYGETFWHTCGTSIDDQMAYAYFPRSGHLYGYDLTEKKLRSFKTPWKPITSEYIEERQKKPIKDRWIDATQFPGLQHAYFSPVDDGQMGFVYKTIDREIHNHIAKSGGEIPVVEKVGAFILYSANPQQYMETEPPSSHVLSKWLWNTQRQCFDKIESLLIPEKKEQQKRPLKNNLTDKRSSTKNIKQ